MMDYGNGIWDMGFGVRKSNKHPLPTKDSGHGKIL